MSWLRRNGACEVIEIIVTYQKGSKTIRKEFLWEHLMEYHLAAIYPYLTPAERQSIRVTTTNGLRHTGSTLRKVERLVRANGWAILFPVAPPERDAPRCGQCESQSIVKIARYEDGRCKVVCMDCQHEQAMTDEEYYVEILDVPETTNERT
jgi:hypothetical protein